MPSCARLQQMALRDVPENRMPGALVTTVGSYLRFSNPRLAENDLPQSRDRYRPRRARRDRAAPSPTSRLTIQTGQTRLGARSTNSRGQARPTGTTTACLTVL